MKGITERSLSRGSLVRSMPWMQAPLSSNVARGFLVRDAGSTVPAAVNSDGEKYFEQRPSPWVYDWQRRGESEDARISLISGGALARAGQVDGRVLWNGDCVVQIHDNDGAAPYARATIENTAAAGDRLQVADGTHTRLYEGEDTLGIFDFLGTQALGDQIRVADGVNTLTLTMSTNTDLALGRVEMGSTNIETAANVYKALVDAVAEGYLAADVVVYQDSSANITLSRYSVAGVLTLTAPTNAGPTINAATLQSLAATGGSVRFAIRSTTAGSAEDLVRAIIWDRAAGNLASDITVRIVEDNLGANTGTIRLRRDAGVVTLSTPVNAGPTFSGVVSMSSVRPLKVKIKVKGFDCLGKPQEEVVTVECEGDGTAPSDAFYRTKYAYMWARLEVLEKENDVSGDFMYFGHEFRHHSLRATMLSVGVDGDTYVIDDGVNAAQTFTFKAAPVGAFDVQIGVSAADTAANLKTKVDAQIGATLKATMFTTLDGSSMLTWDTTAADRAGYKHQETGTTCWLEDGPGKSGFTLRSGAREAMSENNIKIGIPWRCRDIRDLTCVKVDRQHTGDGLAGSLEFNNNSRGVYALDLVRGNGSRAPYIDPQDNSLVVNGYTEMTRSAVYKPSGAAQELKDYPDMGLHFLVFQYDPVEPYDLPAPDGRVVAEEAKISSEL